MNKQIKKTVIFIILTSVICVCVDSVIENSFKPKYEPQDVNKDGVVDIMDMMEIKKYMIDNGIEFQNCGLE